MLVARLWLSPTGPLCEHGPAGGQDTDLTGSDLGEGKRLEQRKYVGGRRVSLGLKT